MTNQMPLEGFQDHTHNHPHDHSHEHPQDHSHESDEAVQVGAQQWLAREFVGGLIAMAQAHGVETVDFLADKCILLAMRAASGESEVQVLRTQLQALTMQNAELQRLVDECPCHDEDVVQPDAVFGSLNTTINGDGTH